MTSIPNQSLAAGTSPGQNTLSDAQFSSYMKKMSASAYESLDAGLTIKTKQGDLVTLTSSSYAQIDAFMYNSRGVLQTESGTSVIKQNMTQITLMSGDSFSFSVVGDLNKEEIEDIASIVKGIDEIISEMAGGDMKGAVAKALSMGGYDSVSMYSADITYQKSYAMTSETQAQKGTLLPDNKTQNNKAQAETADPLQDLPAETKAVPRVQPNILQREEKNTFPSVDKPFPENHRPVKKNHNSIKNIDRFIEKMADQLEKLDKNLVDKAQKPIDKLFNHHLADIQENQGKKTPVYDSIDTARKKINELIDQMVEKGFKDLFSVFKA